MNTKATRGPSLGEDRSSQWETGGTPPSVPPVLHPGFCGQDRILEVTDVLWGSRNKRSLTINLLIRIKSAEIQLVEAHLTISLFYIILAGDHVNPFFSFTLSVYGLIQTSKQG